MSRGESGCGQILLGIAGKRITLMENEPNAPFCFTAGSADVIAPMRIFTDSAHWAEPPCTLLKPLVENPPPAGGGSLAAYYGAAKTLFRCVPREQAEIAVFPCDWQFILERPAAKKRARQFIRANALLGIQPRRIQRPPSSWALSMMTVLSPASAAVLAAA
ncbi:MAG TPA: hypothetical protein VFC44_06075 [Candidatus Saccharimonadales bacterium]|nr:hypothetical protein [Candidatus Saccharimonadales bacterium]